MTDPRGLFHKAVPWPTHMDLDAVHARAQQLGRRRKAGVVAATVATMTLAVGVTSMTVLGTGDESLIPADRIPSASELSPTTSSPESTDSPTTATSSEPSPHTSSSESTDSPAAAPIAAAEEQAAADLFRRLTDFASSPSEAKWHGLPFAGQVQLGLGEDIIKTVPSQELADPDSWILDAYLYAGYAGPFSALDLLARTEQRTVTVGQHGHCAGDPKPAPATLGALSRWSTQPDVLECLRWWTVDLFVEEGVVQAVTLDLWEP